MKKPHLLYWKWNDEVLDADVLQRRTLDIINRSIFDVIYVSLHSVSEKEHLLCGQQIWDRISQCAAILKTYGRELVLDMDIRSERIYLREHPTGECDRVVRYIEGQLDERGCLETYVPQAEDVFVCKCVERDQEGYLVSETITDITEHVYVNEGRIMITAGEKFAGKYVVYFPMRNLDRYDICGEKYKEHRRRIFERAAGCGLAGAGTDEWGLEPLLEIEQTDSILNAEETVKVFDDKNTDLDRAVFVMNWFHVSDGLCQYYRQTWGTELKDDILWFRNKTKESDRDIEIVNQYMKTLRDRVADGEASFYETVKEFFGQDGYVLCHPTWWGDEMTSNLESMKNGLDWWEVKRDYAQTDEMILLPVRMAMSRRCPETLWYNMWYSMRTLDIRTYFRESWVNARYGGRTHYLGYECYEPEVVLTLYQEGRLEAVSALEEQIEKLNAVQHNTRPDARVLIIFGYEAVSNWKLAEPEHTNWKRFTNVFPEIWRFTKGLFDRHYLCDAVPSYEVENGYVTVKDGMISYCGHKYDAAVVLYPVGMPQTVVNVLNQYASEGGRLVAVADKDHCLQGGMSLEQADVSAVCRYLREIDVPTNCGDNYCVYEDGSIIFTTDGELNVGNPLSIDITIRDQHIVFRGEDFLYVNVAADQYTWGSAEYFSINGEVKVGNEF